MIKSNSRSIKKFISISIIHLVFLFIIGGVISNFKGFELRDVLFVEGILILMIGIFSSMGGSTQSLSLQEFGQINPQYFTNIILEGNTFKKERVVSASNIQINIDLISTSIISVSFVALIVSFLL